MGGLVGGSKPAAPAAPKPEKKTAVEGGKVARKRRKTKSTLASQVSGAKKTLLGT